MSFFIRALRFSSKKYLESEVAHIWKTFLNLGYPEKFIKSIYNKTVKKLSAKKKETKKENEKKVKRIVIPYLPGLEELTGILPKDYAFVFQSPNTLKASVVKTKSNNRNDKGVVYAIPCGGCDKKYIGETGNTLKKRISDHKYALKAKNNSNAIYKHYKEQGHVMNWEKAVEIKKKV